MSDELDGRIKAVEAEIAEVKDEIKKVTTRLEELNRERRAGQVVDNERLDKEEEFLRKEKERLGKEMERLGTKEHDLREKEKLLIAKQQQGAGCRSWPPRSSAHVLW